MRAGAFQEATWRNARTSERRSPSPCFLSFLVTCTASPSLSVRRFHIIIFFSRDTVRHGTARALERRRMDVTRLARLLYLSLRTGMPSQLTRPWKNKLPFLDRFTSSELYSLLAAQIARKSRYVSATRARINNGVNEHRTRPTFLPLFDRARSPSCSGQPGIHAGNVR